MQIQQCLAAIALVLALVSPSPAADGGKVGVVDVQKVLILSDAGKEGKEKLAAKAEKLEKQKDLLTEELNKLKTALEKEGMHWAEAEKNAREKEYERKLQGYQQFVTDAQEEFQAKNEELTKAIVGEIIAVIDDYGRANAYSMILMKNEYMVYVDEKSDLTAEILKRVNTMKKAALGTAGT